MSQYYVISYTPLIDPLVPPDNSPTTATVALGINNSGQVLGSYSVSASEMHYFLYDH